jgi:hypothetical protein
MISRLVRMNAEIIKTESTAQIETVEDLGKDGTIM